MRYHTKAEPGWRNGRRAGLKNQWGQPREGSIPSPGTDSLMNCLKHMLGAVFFRLHGLLIARCKRCFSVAATTERIMDHMIIYAIKRGIRLSGVVHEAAPEIRRVIFFSVLLQECLACLSPITKGVMDEDNPFRAYPAPLTRAGTCSNALFFCAPSRAKVSILSCLHFMCK